MGFLDNTPGYLHSDPFDLGFLAVGSIHKIYYEQYGKKGGKPGKLGLPHTVYLLNALIVLFLHGGPGGQTSKSNTVYFNPALYQVVLFDQRGAGKSTPNAEILENTTQHLVDDIEALSNHIGILKWHIVFGGSWGSTLALLYAQAYPDRIGSLILQGIFTGREEELVYSRGTGAALIFPDLFDDLLSYLPEEDRENVTKAYYKFLTSPDRETRLAAARAWNTWDMSIGSILPDPDILEKINDDNWSLAHALLECHYFLHRVWLEDGQIMKKINLDKIRQIPSMYMYRIMRT